MDALTLRFRLGRIPVTVDPWFWLTTLVLAGGLPGPFLAVWVLVAFVSILAHEMGHALVSRRYGATPSIKLYALGGLAYRDRQLPRWQNLAVVLAGPGAGFVLGGAIWALHRVLPPLPGGMEFLLDSLETANLGWGVINLMPVLPLDGGHAMELLLKIRGTARALQISMYAGGALALAAALTGNFGLALFFGALAFYNGQQLRKGR
jgi:membrane-associated protease RseP (regulator of RpoE activity)